METNLPNLVNSTAVNVVVDVQQKAEENPVQTIQDVKETEEDHLHNDKEGQSEYEKKRRKDKVELSTLEEDENETEKPVFIKKTSDEHNIDIIV
jgi:hypothetical protein